MKYEELVDRITSMIRDYDVNDPEAIGTYVAQDILAEVLRTLEMEAHEIEDDVVRDGLEEWLRDSPLAPSK